jgi:HK97 family phage prohead protease
VDDIELTRAEAGAVAVGAEEGRTVELRIVPWGVTAQTADGPEAFSRGAFKGTDATRVTIEAQRHGGPLVGRGVSLEERDDAAYLTARIAPTPAGDELLTLAREGVLQDASVVFVPRTSKRRSDGVVERQSVDLRRVAILERGAYPGAGVVAVRAAEDEVQDMTDQVDIQPLVERIAAVEERAERLAAMSVVPAAAPASPLAGVKSFGELLKRSATDQPELSRALADQIFDNLGDWAAFGASPYLKQIMETVSFGRPVINAFGTRPLPATGMQIAWPTVIGWDADPIQQQAGEKQEIQSSLLQTGSSYASVSTYAGGADISYQLIRRSDPSFLDLWGREMLKGWAQATETAFFSAVNDEDGSHTQNDYDYTTDDDGTELLLRLFQASVDVETETGAPAEFVLAGSDVFKALAGMTRIVPAYAGNMSNAAGNATASTLQVSVNGLRVIHARILPATNLFVSNTQTAKWAEDGPFTITAEDVAKLGQNVAVWGLGAPMILKRNGIVRIYND